MIQIFYRLLELLLVILQQELSMYKNNNFIQKIF